MPSGSPVEGGDLLVGQVVEERQPQHGALLRGQGAHLVGHDDGVDHPLGQRGGRAGSGEGDPFDELAFAGPFGETVGDQAAGDAD